MCTEVQPRRGRNLPPNSLDSRAKKLNPQDRDDYDFSQRWLAENANDAYKDPNSGLVLGLTTMTEVSLCKAHSSALYRAKKKHDNINNPSPPPSPSGSNEVLSHHPGNSPNVCAHDFVPTPSTSSPLMMSHSPLSMNGADPQPSSSMSTSILPSSTNSATLTPAKRKRGRPAGSMSTQLPTSASKLNNPISSASSHLASLSLASRASNTFGTGGHNSNSNAMHITSPTLLSRAIPSLQPLQPLQPRMNSQQHATNLAASNISASASIVETISLRAPIQPHQAPQYFLRNLAITNNFTFRDCLREIDQLPPPPLGKKIVIHSADGDRTYPMDTPIRGVIPAGLSGGPHVELVLALVDVAKVDWTRI
ncbi:hypothetical protein BC938DRAFT_476516 [Jimgerdemannia flammicorona]|uniref:Uncharacterized protein n=2 Tax=Jimgerdemannia flammicorona TaxID=994334 RepID=A0A433QQE6_9FUNG|nr:hypothetical protein BC938DRAFT_476516 [Jimgerdemannia flammicorona]